MSLGWIVKGAIFLLAMTACFVAIFVIGSIIIGIHGFGPGPADYTYNLPGGYEITRNSAGEIGISPKKGASSANPYIPAQVVEVAFDNRFILAKRYELMNNPKHGSSNRVADKTREIYYILDTSTYNIYECSNNETFIQMRVDMGISRDLVLRKVSPFRSH